MKRSDINPLPEYFDRYINLVADVELSQAFDDSIRHLGELDKEILSRLDGVRYAADKWTVKETYQHIIDFERILSYRTLLFARREGSIPAGIDEKLLAAGMKANDRSISELIEELRMVRTSTKAMFASFDDETLQNKGVNWKYEISVLAMGFAIVGHQIHHLKIIEDRYLPLANQN